jgi:hypothetical protein
MLGAGAAGRLPPDRTAIRGREEIRPILARLIDGNCHIAIATPWVGGFRRGLTDRQ